MNNKLETTTGPRCGARFTCKLNNPVHRHRAKVSLSEELLEQINGHHRDRLGTNRLSAIRATPVSP